MARVDYLSVSKWFDGRGDPVVDDLTLGVDDGELLVLLGPSGCGKTTALRMLAGLEDPDAGDIQIDGASVVDLGPRERDVALVFQQYALYPHLSAGDNLRYPLKVTKLSKAEREERVRRAADLLGLTGLLDRKPNQLSGGEQQRVALGRAIVRQPRVFLMDEPLSNLDALLRAQTRTELKSVQRQLGVTTIFVTHDQAEAMTMADRIAVMERGGRLQQVGTPEEVYDRPASIFVAGFIGSPPMNLLPAERDEETIVVCGTWRIPWMTPTSGCAQVAPAKRGGGEHGLVVGLRPEAIALSFEPRAGAQPAEVFLSEPLGSEVIVDVRLGGAVVKVRTAPQVRPQPGQVVSLQADPQRVRLFDAESGLALG